VNNDLEHLWKEAFMVHFKELKDIYQTWLRNTPK
jgi:hypothetical protein